MRVIYAASNNYTEARAGPVVRGLHQRQYARAVSRTTAPPAHTRRGTNAVSSGAGPSGGGQAGGAPGVVALPFTKPQQPRHPLVLLRQTRTLWPLLLQILEHEK